MSVEPVERHLHAVPAEPAQALPHDLAAEQIVLGAMMTSPLAADRVVEILTAADFYRPAHATVFQALAGNLAAQEPLDPQAVAVALQRTGDLNRIGGATELFAMVEAVPTSGMATWYAHRVAECAGRRRLISAGVRIVELGREPAHELPDAVNRAHAALADATTIRERSEGASWAEMVGPLTDQIEAAARGEGYQATTTGLVDLNRVLGGGFRPGQLVVVAGRPGMGKSILLVDFARHVAFNRREPVVLFSLEMSRSEVGQRIISSESRIDLNVIQAGTDSTSAWKRITDAVGRTGDAPLHIEDSPTIDLVELRSTARFYKRRYGQLGMVCVDYLQLMRAGRRIDNRAQEVSELSRGLKLLAKELECPVVTASQLNRGPEQRVDKRPHLADLRESGSVEQDADIVILLHRPDYYIDTDRPGDIDLIVAKHRNGPTGTVDALTQLHCVRIVGKAMEDQ